MKIKRYLDRDMRRVLRRVREDQGPDAVILSNRRVHEGIEVIAAIDYDEALVRHAMGIREEQTPTAAGGIDRDALLAVAESDDATLPEPAAEVVSSDLRPNLRSQQDVEFSGAPAAADSDTSLCKLQDEMSSLRGLLESQLSGLIWKDVAERSPLRAQMLRNLARLGVSADVSGMIVDRLEPVSEVKRLWEAPLAALASMLPVADCGMMKDGGTFALIGPTGVGKTTTIAKMAAGFATTHGADDIALISADFFRIGAKEHLMALANIIGASVYSARTSLELNQLLMRLTSKRLVLIDTEGRSPRDRDLANSLAAFGTHDERVKYFLTLSAATQGDAIDHAIEQFRKVPLEGCIVTKVDEALQLGQVMSAMIRHDLPACWFSDGQLIPEDLHAARLKKMWLVNEAVDRLELARQDPDERALAEGYAAARTANA